MESIVSHNFRKPEPKAPSSAGCKRLRCETLEPRLLLQGVAGFEGPLVISELLAVNNGSAPGGEFGDGGFSDEDGDFSDWIEIHNPTHTTVDLDGWHLTDSDTNFTKWQFPDLSIAPNEYVVVFASDKDRRDAGGELHTNFKLSGRGEYLALVHPDGTTVSHAYAPAFPGQDPDVSYGLGLATSTLLREDNPATYRVPTAADGPLGTSWTDPVFDDSKWAGGSPPSPVLITEPGTDSIDFVEIQNVSDATADTSGWVVAMNDADDRSGSADINAVFPNQWRLPESMAPDQVLYATDMKDDVGHYLEGNIFWRTQGPGWAMLLMPGGKVADFVVWGYNSANLASLDVTIEGHRVTAQEIQDVWHGDPITGSISNGSSRQRVGSDDHDGPADFQLIAPITMGEANADLTTPFPSGPSTGLGFSFDTPAFGHAIGTDVGSVMHGANASLWTRIRFDIEDPAGLDALTLQMKYNDGFVAYLGGVEVARSNAPASPEWNSSATAGRGVEESTVYAQFDLTEFLGLLH